MVKTRKIAKENDRLLSLCRPMTVRLTRDVFSKYDGSKGKINRGEINSSVLTETVALNLRPRDIVGKQNGNKKQSEESRKSKKNKVNSAQIETRSIASAINSTFKNSLEEFEKSNVQLNIGDLILAKMSGFAPWPAKITSFTKDKRRAICYFFGSHNNGPVGVKQIIPFKDGFDTIRLVKMRHLTHFEKGISEIEIEHGIPKDLSSLREIDAIE